MYLKGSKQPFCNFHCAELYKPEQMMTDSFKTPMRQVRPGFTQSSQNWNPITMSAPNYLHGIFDSIPTSVNYF